MINKKVFLGKSHRANIQHELILRASESERFNAKSI